MKYFCIGCGLLLLIAIPSGWPYSFYVFLRWMVALSAVYVSSEFCKSRIFGWAFVFGGLALLFNPVFPFYLAKASWAPIDLIAAVLFFLAGYSTNKTK